MTREELLEPLREPEFTQSLFNMMNVMQMSALALKTLNERELAERFLAVHDAISDLFIEINPQPNKK